MTPGSTAGQDARRRGRRGERIAARWLRRRGHRVLARNLRSGRGELDLLVESPDGRVVIVVEVKAGAGTFEMLAQRVDPAQIRRLHRLARVLHDGPLVRGRSMRIDVALVRLGFPWRHRVVLLRGDAS